jgi:hypothetical protein
MKMKKSPQKQYDAWYMPPTKWNHMLTAEGREQLKIDIMLGQEGEVTFLIRNKARINHHNANTSRL